MPHSKIDAQTRRRAQELRRNMTEPERRLWRRLRDLKPLGLHFRRQAPIGPYIADFVLFSKKLIVELDGDTHGDMRQIGHDLKRTAFLENEGFTVLRVSNADAVSAASAVADAILHATQNNNSTPDQTL